MRKTLIALATAAGVLVGGAAANASTWTAAGGTPVVTPSPTPTFTATGGTPVVTPPKPKHQKPKAHRKVAVRHTAPFTATSLPPIISYAVKVNLWQHTAPNDLPGTRIQLVPGGSEVHLNCWTTGTSELGDSVWYRFSWGDVTGYASGAYILTGHDPVSGVAHC